MRQKQAKLKTFIEVRKGSYITKKDAVPGPYPVILGGREPAYYINKFNHEGEAIVVSRSGASAGYVSFWNEPIFITDGFLIEGKPGIDYHFLYYLLKSKQNELNGLQRGAAIPHVTPSLINDVDVHVPPIEEQRRIASILKAYDNLIENNRRQIALLEEAADLIYGEWLAGCDDSSFKTGVMSDFFDVTIGKTPPRSQSECFVSEGIPWASVKDLGATNGAYISSTSECLTQDAVDSYNVKVKPAETILLSFKLTIGRVAIAEQPIATNEAIAHFETDDDAVRLYTYEYLRNFDYDTLGSTSSIGKAINSNIVKSIPFFMPDADSLDRFHSQLNPVFRLMRYCQRRVALLSESRNLLLPKLMSGEIEV